MRSVHNMYMARPPRRFRPHLLRPIRKAKGLTLEAVAERVGVSHATIQRIETFQQPLGQPILDDLALALRVTRGQILDGPVPDTD